MFISIQNWQNLTSFIKRKMKLNLIEDVINVELFQIFEFYRNKKGFRK